MHKEHAEALQERHGSVVDWPTFERLKLDIDVLADVHGMPDEEIAGVPVGGPWAAQLLATHLQDRIGQAAGVSITAAQAADLQEQLARQRAVLGLN